MKTILLKLPLLFLCASLYLPASGQILDEPAEKDKTIPKGFFTMSLGAQSSLGYGFTSFSYNHLIGHFGGDSYLGVEIGFLGGDDGAYRYQYIPFMLSYTGIIGGQNVKKRFLGYASLKVGTAIFTSAERITTSTLFVLPPSEENLGAFQLTGGGQLKLAPHLFLHAEAGLGTMYTILFGITGKL